MNTQKYNLTLEQFNILQELMCQCGPQVTLGELQKNALVEQCNPATLPNLTPNRISAILGESWPQMLVYRFYTGGGFRAGWNMTTYNGYDFTTESDIAATNLCKTRDILQKMPAFNNRLIMACATKTIVPDTFRGTGNIINNPTYAKSEYAAGNMIIYNMSTDNLETLPGWFGIGGMDTTYRAALHAPSNFAREILRPGTLALATSLDAKTR